MERILNDWLITAAYLLAKAIQHFDHAIHFKEAQEMITKTFLYTLNLVIIWLSPIKGALIFTALIVIADTITGIMKAGKDDVRNISSKKSFPMVPKTIFYMTWILVAQSCHNYVDPQVPWVKLSLMGIGWIEVRSIDENFKAIYGFSFLDKILEGIRSVNRIKRHKE